MDSGYAQAGLLSREIKVFGVPTSLSEAEGNIVGGAIREPSVDPARSKNLCMCGISGCENREVPWLPAPVDDAPSWMDRGVAYRQDRGSRGER